MVVQCEGRGKVLKVYEPVKEMHVSICLRCVELQLGDRDKPMDIISRWAGLVHHYGGEKTHEIPQLYLRANVFAFPERHKHVCVCVVCMWVCVRDVMWCDVNVCGGGGDLCAHT